MCQHTTENKTPIGQSLSRKQSKENLLHNPYKHNEQRREQKYYTHNILVIYKNKFSLDFNQSTGFLGM